jgi:hypothetical protein
MSSRSTRCSTELLARTRTKERCVGIGPVVGNGHGMDYTILPSLDHLQRLCGEHGIVQFAKGDVPDLESGFCLDDNVRLLVLALSIRQHDPENSFAHEAGHRVLDFIADASHEAPMYHNMMDQHGSFTDRFASPESIGRLIRALGLVLRDSEDENWRNIAAFELRRAMSALPALSSEHARAFAALGLAAAVESGAIAYRAPLRALAEAMNFELERNSAEGWTWPLPEMTYDNGRLPEALMRAGDALGDGELSKNGQRAMEFLAGVVQSRDLFEPIGAPGWYPRGGERPHYAAQPLEALAMIDAWLAYGDTERAQIAYEWYLGRNRQELTVADESTGGCHDGIDGPDALNACMGAESTLAFVQACLTMRGYGPDEIVMR